MKSLIINSFLPIGMVAEMIVTIPLEELVFRVDQNYPVGMSKEDGLRHEEHVFEAHYENELVGHLRVFRCITPKTESAYDGFLFDMSSTPPTPIPIVFFTKRKEGYEKMGIATELIDFANRFYKVKYGTPIQSGTQNNDDAVRFLSVLQVKARQSNILMKINEDGECFN
jgi:hypothetical protein